MTYNVFVSIWGHVHMAPLPPLPPPVSHLSFVQSSSQGDEMRVKINDSIYKVRSIECIDERVFKFNLTETVNTPSFYSTIFNNSPKPQEIAFKVMCAENDNLKLLMAIKTTCGAEGKFTDNVSPPAVEMKSMSNKGGVS